MSARWPDCSDCAVGSFLNVCIYRLPLEQSLAYPPSRCMSCDRRLTLVREHSGLRVDRAGGRCRTCRTPISAVYPLVEAFTGVMFVWATWHYGPELDARSRGCSLGARLDRAVLHRPRSTASCRTSSRCRGVVIGFLLSFVTPPGWIVITHRPADWWPDPAGGGRGLPADPRGSRASAWAT